MARVKYAMGSQISCGMENKEKESVMGDFESKTKKKSVHDKRAPEKKRCCMEKKNRKKIQPGRDRHKEIRALNWDGGGRGDNMIGPREGGGGDEEEGDINRGKCCFGGCDKQGQKVRRGGDQQKGRVLTTINRKRKRK